MGKRVDGGGLAAPSHLQKVGSRRVGGRKRGGGVGDGRVDGGGQACVGYLSIVKQTQRWRAMRAQRLKERGFDDGKSWKSQK